ncbi:DUF6350 family protein [Microbacterium sp. ProA8]|uniref:cell division protein PerM n=1 Tax=Microbacterium chionoecetis TaxID=3153754 RepID=UPI003267849A
MHRLIVALLAAVDAAIAVAVGLAATLAPLTLLWVFGFGGEADWGVLWPSAVSVWQLGNLVPLHIALPPEYLAATGISGDAAHFVLSLAPLAFAGFTAIFAARSGARASHADAWLTGVATSTVVFAALATGAALSGANDVAHAETWQAILIPTLVFALPALVAAVVTEWSEAGSGAIARLRDRAETLPHGWGAVPALIARGSAVVLVSLIGVGAAIAAVALFARAGQIVALFQAGDVDALGASVLTLAQLAYVPTLAVWGLSFVAGPGFAVGEGTSVSPAGTQVGVVPGLPALGAVPDSTTSWLLLLGLLPVAIGAFAGWIARSRLLHPSGTWTEKSRQPSTSPGATASSPLDPSRTAALSGLLSSSLPADRVPAAPVDREPPPEDPIGARVVVTGGIALVAGGAAALLAFAASGSLGPGRLSTFGPEPGPVALAVGLEVLLGAAILLLAPRSVRGERSAADAAPAPAASDEATSVESPAAGEPAPSALAGAWTGRRAVDEASDRPTTDAGGEAAPQPIPGVAAADARTEPIDLPPLPPRGDRDRSE